MDAELDAIRARLAGAPTERLGALRLPRRVFGIARAPRIEPAGRAWHLGALLLGEDTLLATGEIVRAREEVRRGYAAQSQRDRAAVAAAAFRGGFAEGETVHIDWRVIDLDAVANGAASGPVALVDGVVSVRWSPGGDFVPLIGYLRERAELLAFPAPGAT